VSGTKLQATAPGERATTSAPGEGAALVPGGRIRRHRRWGRRGRAATSAPRPAVAGGGGEDERQEGLTGLTVMVQEDLCATERGMEAARSVRGRVRKRRRGGGSWRK
jgi:hypothetical protein